MSRLFHREATLYIKRKYHFVKVFHKFLSFLNDGFPKCLFGYYIATYIYSFSVFNISCCENKGNYPPPPLLILVTNHSRKRGDSDSVAKIQIHFSL